MRLTSAPLTSNMIRSIRLFASISACGLFYFAPGIHAAIYTEVGNTGDLPATAQNVGAGIDRIVGTLFPPNEISDVEIDVYRVTFVTAGLITFETRSLNSTPSGGTLTDPNLFLFNSSGNPLAGDDDDAGGVSTAGSGVVDSAFQLNLAAGTYYVAIGANETAGLNAALQVIVFDDAGVVDPGGVIADWERPRSVGGTYEILLSQVTVPEPSSLALLTLGAMGLGAMRRRRRLALFFSRY